MVCHSGHPNWCSGWEFVAGIHPFISHHLGHIFPVFSLFRRFSMSMVAETLKRLMWMFYNRSESVSLATESHFGDLPRMGSTWDQLLNSSRTTVSRVNVWKREAPLKVYGHFATSMCKFQWCSPDSVGQFPAKNTKSYLSHWKPKKAALRFPTFPVVITQKSCFSGAEGCGSWDFWFHLFRDASRAAINLPPQQNDDINITILCNILYDLLWTK